MKDGGAVVAIPRTLLKAVRHHEHTTHDSLACGRLVSAIGDYFPRRCNRLHLGWSALGPIGRRPQTGRPDGVPGDGDTATVNSKSTVHLVADTGLVDALTLSANADLQTDGYLLLVDDVGSSGETQNYRRWHADLR